VDELSKAGSLVDLEVDLEVGDTRKQHLLVLLDPAVLVAPQVDQAASEVDSVGASKVEEVEVVSEVDSKIAEAMVEDEAVLDIKEAEASHQEVVKAETVVGILETMVTAPPLMLQLVQVVVVAAGSVAEGVSLVRQIATVLAVQRQLVGLIPAVVVAHTMIGTAGIVAAAAAEATATAMALLEVGVAATWSR
jgi:hypothetical protein